MLKSIGHVGGAKTNVIGLRSYEPAKFQAKTTNQDTYKGFKLNAKPKVATTKVKAVRSKALPTHFDTNQKKEYVRHDLKPCALDAIPYP